MTNRKIIDIMINKELQTYYEERFSMMSTQAWHQLMEDVQIMFENYSNINTVNTVEELQYRKGQLDIIQWLLSLEDISEASYKELQE